MKKREAKIRKHFSEWEYFIATNMKLARLYEEWYEIGGCPARAGGRKTTDMYGLSSWRRRLLNYKNLLPKKKNKKKAV